MISLPPSSRTDQRAERRFATASARARENSPRATQNESKLSHTLRLALSEVGIGNPFAHRIRTSLHRTEFPPPAASYNLLPRSISHLPTRPLRTVLVVGPLARALRVPPFAPSDKPPLFAFGTSLLTLSCSDGLEGLAESFRTYITTVAVLFSQAEITAKSCETRALYENVE